MNIWWNVTCVLIGYKSRSAQRVSTRNISPAGLPSNSVVLCIIKVKLINHHTVMQLHNKMPRI